ncbi:MAG: YfhO family protein [Clostridia bacterium]|nr:YfhO family protein [Clostridia bacterium]
MGRKRWTEYWLWSYTGLFLCGMAVLTLVLLVTGKTLVWSVDGVRQPYVVLGFLSRLIRQLLRGDPYRMMSFSLGQGMDIMTTCTYYGYTDPLSLLSVFFSGNGLETAYTLICFLRIYLAGVFAGLYFRRVGVHSNWAIALGAVIYVFSGYPLNMIGMHPYFLNGALYLPLMLLSIERVFDGRRWLLYVFTTALMLIVNFYFAYMNTFVAIIYIIVRLMARLGRRGVSESAKDGFMLLGGWLLGAAIAAIVFLPVVHLYLSNSRLTLEAGYSGNMLHYSKNYYVRLLAYAFSPWKSAGEYTLLNYAPLAMVGLLALCFVRNSLARQVRLALILGTVMLCVPAAGYVMNGTAYVSNRWSYAFGLFVALGSAIGMANLFQIKRSRRIFLAFMMLVYSMLLAYYFVSIREKMQLVGVVAIAFIPGLILVYDAGVPKLNVRRMRMLMSLFLAATSTAYIVMGFLLGMCSYASEEMDRGFYNELASDAAGQFIEAGPYRIGQGRYDDAQSLMFDYMGTSYFWSLVDGGNSKYYQELQLPSQTAAWHVFGLCGSAPLNAVAAVRYITQQADENWVIPYGFELSDEIPLPDGTRAAVYENKYSLPMAYAYDCVMSNAEYDSLSVEDKYQALTAYAVCDVAEATPTGFAGAASQIDFAVASTKDVYMEGNRISAQDGGTMVLEFDAPEDCEIYLLLEGMGIDQTVEKSKLRGGIIVESERGTGEGNTPNPRNNFYFPKQGLAFCLGSGPLQRCKLTFENTLNYAFDRMRIVCIPMEGYRNAVKARQAEGMEDIRLGNDSLHGRISVSGDRILQIAVPYSSGWQAWVDGEEKPIFRCGGMYMGIELMAGTHEIEMRYVTPGLIPGMWISTVAIVLTAVLAVVSSIRRRRGVAR